MVLFYSLILFIDLRISKCLPDLLSGIIIFLPQGHPVEEKGLLVVNSLILSENTQLNLSEHFALILKW